MPLSNPRTSTTKSGPNNQIIQNYSHKKATTKGDLVDAFFLPLPV